MANGPAALLGDRAWARIVALAPRYGKYEQQTDREIPVVRLTPRPRGG